MKKYVSPELKAVNLLTADIVTMSNGGAAPEENDNLPGVSAGDLFL